MLVAIGVGAHAGQEASSRPAVPLEPVAAIVEAFRSHRLVALPDAHGNE